MKRYGSKTFRIGEHELPISTPCCRTCGLPAAEDGYPIRCECPRAPLAVIPTEAMAPKLLIALKAALPYVEKAAAVASIEPSRLARQRKAQDDAADIRAIIAVAERCA